MAAKARSRPRASSPTARRPMLMHGTWFVRQNPAVAADRRGLSAEQMGFLGFPMLPAGPARRARRR